MGAMTVLRALLVWVTAVAGDHGGVLRGPDPARLGRPSGLVLVTLLLSA